MEDIRPIIYQDVDPERYTISSDGLNVYDNLRKKEVKINKDHNQGHSYMFCQLRTKENKRIQPKIHQLIYTTFIDSNYKAEDIEIHHIDGNPHNNHIDNLTAITKKIHRAIS